jgi:arginase
LRIGVNGCATILPGGRALEISVATFEFGLRYPEAYRIVPIVVAMGTDFLRHDRVVSTIRKGGRVAKEIGLIGVPTSMGAFAPGQEKGPEALREADLLGRLSRAGVEVVDHGDGGGVRRWRPDKRSRRAQNLPAVMEVVRETAGRVGEAHAARHLPLVVGGDCTIELGTVSGLLPPEGSGGRMRLIYFDVHPDLNVPASVVEGALDWMGMAHMLGEEGAVEPLSQVGPRFPMLGDEDVFLFSYGPEQATEHERSVIGHRGLKGMPVEEVAPDPEGAAARALEEMEPHIDLLLVHFDVDTVDFTDLPLSENPGRNEGLPFDSAMRALGTLLGSDRLAAVTVTEFNPYHGEEDGSTAEALADGLATALSGSPALGNTTATKS